MRSILFILSILVSGGVLAQSQDLWIQKDSINGAPRSAASSFVLEGEGYTICGLDDGGFRRKMYSYTYWQDDWDDELSLGGENGSGLNRGSASAFAINDKGYVCLGQGETGPFYYDLWEYDPVTKAWTQKADFIGSPRRMSVGFAIDSLGYVGLGISPNGMEKDMYQYSPATNSWTQLNDFAGTARKEAVGFTMGGQGYVGTGDDGVYRKDFWKYEPTTDNWTQLADLPGAARAGAVGWGIFPQAFICLGEDINFNYSKELWEYNYYSDTWTQRADYAGSGRKSAIAFVLNDIAFVGSGYDGEMKDDMYSYNRVLGLEDLNGYNNISCFPNPSVDNIQINVDPTDLQVKVIGLDGKEITSLLNIQKQSNVINIERNSVSSGEYLLVLEHNSLGAVYSKKIVFI